MSESFYRTLNKDELEFHFEPRTAVPEHPRFRAERGKVSARVRGSLKSFFDVPYGTSPRESLDIFPAEAPGSPVLVYIHGGYWRGGSKEDNSFLAETFVQAGATVVVLGYDLCPRVTVTDIVRQTRAAVAWIYRHISDYWGDPSRLFLSGSSAGGHLVAMALAYDWQKMERLPADLIKGSRAITGVYDLEPVLHVSANQEIKLNPGSARENSPLLNPPVIRSPILIVVGQDEAAGWKKMSQDYYAVCKKSGLDCEYMEVAGTHHFSVSWQLSDPASQLCRAIFRLMGL
ncbi:MAG: alpha/beta hydrolase [Candidatus Binatia bacterium]|nr:alpha/beta hydrolase [Candidatus Binatia bacterium]